MNRILQEPNKKYSKGSILAITANSGGFRLCELVEDLFNNTNEAKVRFLLPSGKKYNDNCFYKPFFNKHTESISCELILTDVKICSISRLMCNLPETEIANITSAINNTYSALQYVLPTTTNSTQIAYCNKDDYTENLCATVISESFENHTLCNLKIQDEVKSITQNIDLEDLCLFETPHNNHFDNASQCKNTYDEAGHLNIFDVENSNIAEVQASESSYVPSEISCCKTKSKFKGLKRKRTTKCEKSKQIKPSIDKQEDFNNLGKDAGSSDKLEDESTKIISHCNNNANNLKPSENWMTEKSSIYFSATTKNHNKRVYDKKHVCLFCNRAITKVTRHLSSCHSSETEVAKLLSLPSNCLEKKLGFVELMRMGDFNHNCNVLAIEEGELILVRRPSERESSLLTYKDFEPCPGCTGFMFKKHLWHHTRECSFIKKKKNETEFNKNIQQQSNALISAVLHPNMDENFKKNVLCKINEDSIGKTAKLDDTILSFGMMMVDKHEDEQYELIRQSMRQLARLLLELRKVTNYPDSSLRDFIKPSNFDDIILAVRNISGINNNCNKVVPSLALKLGYHLQKCAGILRGKALRLSNSDEDRCFRQFLELYNLEWQSKKSSSALNVMNKRTINSVNMIPLTSDLMKINSALISELKVILQNKVNNMDTETWLKLAKLTLCRLIMFNKKRGGEAAKITIQQYASKPETENFLQSLSKIEQYLIKKLTLIEIRGKRRRVVPVLLTEDVNSAIALLINTRESVGVSKYNPYIFARPYSNSLQALRGSDCLRDFVNTLDLQKPKLINSTKLRKYIATTSQVFNLQENEVDWLARHLGHDINVHRNFYRIQHSAIELTKVIKLLMAVEKGKIQDFAGKTLDEITLEDLCDDECASNIDVNDEVDNDEVDNDDDSEMECTVQSVAEDVITETEYQFHREKDVENRTDVEKELQTGNSILNRTEYIANGRKNSRKPVPHKGKKIPWTTEEKKFVLTFFKDSIKNRSLPGKTQCVKCINTNKALLGHRSWTKIKDFMRNYFKSLIIHD